MGSRGAGSGRGGTFASEAEFEKSLKSLSDPRLKQYTDAYDEEAEYTAGLKRNLSSSIDENGYTLQIENVLSMEKKDTQKALDNLPKKKTPAQLGTEKALNERLKVINNLRKRILE